MIVARKWIRGPSWSAWSEGLQPLDAVLYSADEPKCKIERNGTFRFGPSVRGCVLFLAYEAEERFEP